jgi:hypothetical protein
MDKVLGVQELLGAILLQVDMGSLLTSCLRVCQKWNMVITTSPRIQRHLFLSEDPDAEPIHNPLLEKHFPFIFTHVSSPLNELNFFSLTKEPMDHVFDMPFPELAMIWERTDAYSHPRASWKRMLVHQPPFHGVGFLCTHRSASVYSRRSLIRQEPTKLPELLKAALSHFHIFVEADEDSPIVPSGFRVIWRQLPQDITKEFHLANETDTMANEGASEGDNETPMQDANDDANQDGGNDAEVLSTDSSEAAEQTNTRRAFDEQMDFFGILVHHDFCSDYRTRLDPRQFILYEILHDVAIPIITTDGSMNGDDLE